MKEKQPKPKKEPKEPKEPFRPSGEIKSSWGNYYMDEIKEENTGDEVV